VARALTAEAWQQFTDPDYLTKLIGIVWGRRRAPSCWSQAPRAGELVGALRERGIDASASRTTAPSTPRREGAQKYNKLGSIYRHAVQGRCVRLRVRDQLCHISPKQVVARSGADRVVKTGTRSSAR